MADLTARKNKGRSVKIRSCKELLGWSKAFTSRGAPLYLIPLHVQHEQSSVVGKAISLIGLFRGRLKWHTQLVGKVF